MISIIICSREQKSAATIQKNIDDTIGIDHEVIVIDNSRGQYSIFSAYNRGVEQSKYPYLCFVHEDVFFHTSNWGEKIVEQVKNPQTGIVGFAGGDLVSQVPASWSILSPSINIIQSTPGHKEKKYFHFPKDYDQDTRTVILLDGVFLGMRRNLFEKVKFDETLDGFHGYDFDISIQSSLAGYINYVMYNIELEHYSAGRKSRKYFENLIAIYKKWSEELPILGHNVSDAERARLSEIEITRLQKLIRKMAATGFSSKDIIAHTKYFIRRLNTEEAERQIKYIHFKIFITRLVKSPQYLFR